MISQAGRWTQTPFTTLLQSKKMKCSFFDYVQLLMIGWAGRWTQTPSTTPLQPKTEMLIFGLCSLLMIGWAGWWTWTPSATPLRPNKWNAHFSNTFNFWWSAWLVNGLETHLPPLSTQKNETLNFGLCSTSHDLPGWSMDSDPIHCPYPAKKWNPHFWIMFTSDNLPGWLINLNPICHPSPTKKIKCSIFNYVQLLMISQADRWTQTPSATPLQPKKWNAHLWITFNFWWSAGLVDGLKPHLPPLSSQKHEMLIFVLHSTSDVGQTCQWTWTPSTTPLQPKKEMLLFWITLNFWWLAGLSDGLKPHPPSVSSQKNEMLIFGLCSTSDDRLGWLVDSNPILHPSPAKKVKCSFLYYIQHLMLARLVNGLEPHPPLLSSQKYEMLIFGLCSTSGD